MIDECVGREIIPAINHKIDMALNGEQMDALIYPKSKQMLRKPIYRFRHLNVPFANSLRIMRGKIYFNPIIYV